MGMGITLLAFVILNTFVQQASNRMVSEPWLTIWLELAVVLFVGLLLLLWRMPWQEIYKHVFAIGLLSLLLTFVVLATLKTTPYTLDALSGDQGLYTAYVTKFATYSGNVDAIYADLPAFYPPLYFYVLGRLAAWFQIEPFKLLQVGLLATTLLLPYALAWFWRQVVALPLAVAAAFTLLVDQQWYKPAEWFTMVLFVPWWLYWVENVTQRTFATWRARWRWWIVGGVIGALIFQTYYYWFFVGGLSVLIQVTAGLFGRSPIRTISGIVRNTVPMLVSSACFSAFYWGPYLYSMISTGGWQVLQNRWLALGKIMMPLPFAAESFAAIGLLVGVLYLAASANTDRVSRSLLYFLVAVYGWFALGYVGMLVNMPLLSFRAYPLVYYVPALGLGFFLMRFWRGDWQGALRKMGNYPISHLSLSRMGATLLIVMAFFFAQTTVVVWLKNEDVPKAVAMEYPAEQMRALDDAIQGDYEDKTILLSRDYADWVAYRPFFTFLAWSAHYSHPAGLFHERLDLLETLTTVHTPELFIAVLLHNRYAQIDHLLLRPMGDAWTMTFLVDNFPIRNVQRRLAFAAENLTAPYIVATPALERVLLTPQQTADPLPRLRALDPTTAPLVDVALLYILVADFDQHLALGGLNAMRTGATTRLQASDLASLPANLLVDLYQAAEGSLREQAYTALTTTLAHPLNQLLTDQIGVEKVNVIGYEVKDGEEGTPTIVLYLEILDELDWDYTVWVHAFQSDSKETLDFTPVQPTSTWRPQRVVALTRTLPLAAGEHDIQMGFWRSEEDVRLIIPTGEFGVSLETVTIP